MKNKKSIVVSVTNDLYTDQRVHKMCTFMESRHYEVLLVGRLLDNKAPLNRTYKTKRFKLFFRKGALFYANYNIRLFIFLLFHRFDLLVSNDLDTLLANTLIHQIKGTPIIYDSHEYFTEVPELVSRPRIQHFWEQIEGYCFPKLDKIITVNASIAGKYHQKYGKDLRIVRNVSPLFHPDHNITKKQFNLPENKTILILQGAGINIDRGGEELIDAMQFLPQCFLLIVGSGDVLEILKERVISLKIEERVRFIGRLPYAQMMQYTLLADIGLSMDKPTNENYLYSLPNKIFDYMHAETAVVVSNLPEIVKVIEKYQIGKIIPSHQPKDIATTIQQLVEDPYLLASLKENCRKARLLENWEKEVENISDFYPEI